MSVKSAIISTIAGINNITVIMVIDKTINFGFVITVVTVVIIITIIDITVIVVVIIIIVRGEFLSLL